MSKLPNAPLVEVIFELRWKVTDKEELTKCQYLHGDLYASLKDHYKFREALIAPEVPIELYLNAPAHRFRVAQNDYPLVQVGPGLITLNTVDSKYIWEDYEEQIKNVIKIFLEVYQFNSQQEISLSLQYFDFFKFNFESNNVFDFISNNLNITVKQNFFDNSNNPNNINLGFHYNTDLGSLSISVIRGIDIAKSDGIIMQTNIKSKLIKPDLNLVNDWLGKSHEFCSTLFKDMTKGTLYESFCSTKK
jgi:uncharacterized protein (TIGR04255 family)